MHLKARVIIIVKQPEEFVTREGLYVKLDLKELPETVEASFLGMEVADFKIITM